MHNHWTIDFKDTALTQLTGEGSAPLESTYVLTQSPCVLAGIAPSPGGARIPEFQLVPNPRGLMSLTNRPTAAGISLLFNPFLAAPQENITIVCPPIGNQIHLQGFWAVGFGEAYRSSLKKTTQGQIYRIDEWQDGSDDVLGQKDDTFTVKIGSSITLDVRAKWTLRHAPIPFHYSECSKLPLIAMRAGMVGVTWASHGFRGYIAQNRASVLVLPCSEFSVSICDAIPARIFHFARFGTSVVGGRYPP